VFFLPPQEPEFIVLPPPVEVFVLPVPMFVAPAYVRPAAYVAPQPDNIVFANIHNTTPRSVAAAGARRNSSPRRLAAARAPRQARRGGAFPCQRLTVLW
jgi:hypothetical protein